MNDLRSPVWIYFEAGNHCRYLPGDDVRQQGTQHERWTRTMKATRGNTAQVGATSGAAMTSPAEMAYTAMMRGGPTQQKNRGVVMAATYASMVQ